MNHVDAEIEELKKLVRRSMAVSEHTNLIVQKVRRAQVWGSILHILWWVAIGTLLGVAYHYYIQPYVDQIVKLYQILEHSGAQAQDFGQQVSSFFANWPPQATSTPTSF